MSVNPIALLDITLSCEKNSFQAVRTFLEGYFKQWIFQKERGDNGYEHWQIRGSAIHKRRIQEHSYKWRTRHGLKPGDVGIVFSDEAISPTCNSVVGDKGRKTFSYVLKEDTRIEGPWRDTDEVKVCTKSVEFLQKKGLDPWQNEILESLKNYDHRSINVLVDKRGNIGKTTFEDWLTFHGHACDLWFGPRKDMMEEAYAMRGKSAYTINLPRALNKKEMHEFWEFIEQLKDGRVRDARYKAKRMRMERPVIWIFTNDRPLLETQSMDRWKFWEVDGDNNLVPEGMDFVDE